MSLYEQSSQILTVNVDCFGDLGGKTKVLERYHLAVVACLEFMRRLLDGELISDCPALPAEKPKRPRISTKQPEEWLPTS